MGTLALDALPNSNESQEQPDSVLAANLTVASPTKPLTFHSHAMPTKERDCNSSSDTYVSDTGVLAPLVDNGVATPSEEAAAGSWPPLVPEKSEIIVREALPSKSIMKPSGTPSSSPRKSVAFPAENNLETHHLYTPATDHEPHSPAILDSISHHWSGVDKDDGRFDISSASPPPVPPPHTSNTITGLLTRDSDEEHDDVDISVLSEYRLSHKNYSNLSLNEKLDIFLNNSSQAAHDDLDDHLDKLAYAKKEETDVNIHHLSFQLADQTTVENPLNVLYETQKVQLRSAGSSQSSLQSLMDSNRFLHSNNISALSKGIQFNDGIQGFPDAMADLMIPSTDVPDKEVDSSSDMLTFGLDKKSRPEPVSEDEQVHDSFNISYNLTEKSILNLLNSASQVNLPGAVIAAGNGPEAEAPKDIQHELVVPQTTKETIDSSSQPQQQHALHTEVELQQTETEVPAKFQFQIDQNLLHQLESVADQMSRNFEPPSAEQTREENNEEHSEDESPVKEEPQESFVKTEPKDSFVKTEPQDSFVKAEPERSFVKTEELSAAQINLPSVLEPVVKQEANTSVSKDLSSLQLIKKEEMSQILTPKDVNTSDSEHSANEKAENFGKSLRPSTPLGGESREQHSEHGLKSPASFIGDDHSEELDFTENASIHIVDSDLAYKTSGDVRLVESSLTTPKRENFPLSISGADSSNDGDVDEDVDDEVIKSPVKLETVHHQKLQHTDDSTHSSGALSEEFEDTSDILHGKSLAPPKLERVVVTSNRDSVQDFQPTREDMENSILANSSNIHPPSHLMPPRFTTQSRNLDPGSTFEDSLSAEHDKDKKDTDFISIWHSQLQKRKHDLPRAELTYNVPNLLTYNTAEVGRNGSYKIPTALQQKKFKEVNVVSKRVVSPGFDDYHVSGFLPEISQDSGLEGHFRGLLHNTTVQSEMSDDVSTLRIGRSKSLGMHSVLSQIDDASIQEPPAPSSIQKKRHSIHNTLRPVSVSVKEINNPQTTLRKSRFHVPSFEIKRSNSTLSPKNFYNDIFEDSASARPTIKASGMKTLPSMDREDVKRIMQMKQAMSQEEYSNLKHVGPRKQSVIQEPADKYDKLQQLASLHCDSLMSTRPPRTQRSSNNPFSHVVGELSSVPVAIESKDEILNDLHIFQIKADDLLSTPKQNDISSDSPLPNRRNDVLAFPEPDADLISDSELYPAHEILALADVQSKVDANPKPLVQIETNTSSPSKAPVKKSLPVKKMPAVTVIQSSPHTPPRLPTKTSPIKINASPVRLIKNGASVTGVVLDKKIPTLMEFEGSELTNEKIRNQGQKHEHGLSTVSVPSNLTAGNPLEPESQPRVVSEPHESSAGSTIDLERGKLFLRVVGLKGIELPDIKTRKGAFSITLDNGVHCIKTPNYKLESQDVLIGKEFELVVGKSLEFILTMKATYDKPKGTLVEVKERKVVKSKNRLSRMFGSKDVITTTKFVPRDVKDPWKNKFATDGSFARCYVDLEQYEQQITGVARNFNITCFNEWETTTTGENVTQCRPYKIAQLEVKMLFVPKTEQYEVLPTSIKSAYESLDELRNESHLNYEGYMHQDGGDCDTWKKRWFKLSGTSLIAHSEFTHKTRAKINLAKVVEVIYVDKENVDRSSSNFRNFSDILLVENAFKIRFANGEIIDFGAPNREEKLRWIKMIQEIVYRNKFRRQPWIILMQERNGNSRPRSIMTQ